MRNDDHGFRPKKSFDDMRSRKSRPDDDDDRPRRKIRAEDDDDRPRRSRADEDGDDRPRRKTRADGDDDRPRKSRADEDDDRPRRKVRADGDDERPRRSRADEDDDDRPRRKIRAEDDDDRPRRSRRDEDDDERPRRSRHDDDDDDRSIKKKRKNQPSKVRLFAAIGGGVFFLALVAVGGFIWPGFFAFGKGRLADEMLSLAPSDSIFAFGLNLGPIRKDENFKKQFDDAREEMKKAGAPAEIVDLIADADRLMVAGSVRAEKPVFIAALTTLQPWDVDKIKKLPMVDLGAAETDKGVTFHRVKVPDPSAKDLFLAIPDPKLLVLGLMPKDDFVKCLQNRRGRPTVSADLLAACRANSNTFLWAGIANDGELKKQLDKVLKDVELKELAILAKAKSAGITYDYVVKDGMKFEVNLNCANAADAETIKKTADGGWTMLMVTARAGMAQLDKGGGAKEAAAPLKTLLEEFEKSFKINQNGNTVIASLKISDATVKELEKLSKQAGEPGGGMAGAAAQFMPLFKVREAAARTQGMNNLKQMALAMHIYHDVYKQLPSAAICDPAGKRLLSWRVAILPYVEQMPLYHQFRLDEPWDSEHNKKLIALMPELYRNPKRSDAPGYTNYRVLVGGGGAFEWNKGMALARDFADGTSNTLLIVEAGSSVPWTKPDELVYEPKGPLPRFDNHGGKGFDAAMADGSARSVATVREPSLRALITRSGGEPPGD